MQLFHHRIKLHFCILQWKSVILISKNISQYSFYCIIYQINAALVSIKDLLKNLYKMKLPIPNMVVYPQTVISQIYNYLTDYVPAKHTNLFLLNCQSVPFFL